MANEKLTVGALIVGLALGGVGGVALDPAKKAALADISVAEMVASKIDSTTQRIIVTASAQSSDSSVVRYYDAAGTCTSERTTYAAHTAIRAEEAIRVPAIPVGSTFRLVSFIDEKAVSEWLTQNSDSAPLSAMAQIVLYKAGK